MYFILYTNFSLDQDIQIKKYGALNIMHMLLTGLVK